MIKTPTPPSSLVSSTSSSLSSYIKDPYAPNANRTKKNNITQEPANKVWTRKELATMGFPPGREEVDYSTKESNIADFYHSGEIPNNDMGKHALLKFLLDNKRHNDLYWKFAKESTTEILNANLANCGTGPDDPNGLTKENIETLFQLLNKIPDAVALDCSYSRFSKPGAIVLSEQLKSNKTVILLNLTENLIGPKSTVYIAGMLTSNSTLTSLSICDNFIQSEGISTIFTALQNNSTLTSLAIAGAIRADENGVTPKLSDDAATAMNIMVSKNKTLRSLSLTNIQISPNNIPPFMQALLSNPESRIASLDFSGNNLGKEGVQFFHKMLASVSTINSLNLSENEIVSEDASIICDMLKLTHLTSLNLSGNNIGTAGAKLIANELNTNKSLTTLNLEDNNIDEEGIKAILDAVKSNKESKMTLLSLKQPDHHPSLGAVCNWLDLDHKSNSSSNPNNVLNQKPYN